MKVAGNRIDGHVPRQWQLVLFTQIIVLVIILLIALLQPLFIQQTGNYVYPVCVFLLLLLAWTLWSWRELTGNLFNPYILFITAAFAFNAGLAFLEVFHLNKGGILEGFIPQQTILMTLLLVAIGLAAFHSGALAAVMTTSRQDVQGGTGLKKEQDGRPLRLVGWTLICVAAIPMGLVLKQSFAVETSSGYSSLFQQQIPIGVMAWRSVLSLFLIPGLLFLLAGSKGKLSGILASSSIILAYCAVLFFLGDRGEAIMLLLAFLWLFDRCIRKVPKSALALIAIVLVVVLIPLFGVFRNVTGQERYSLTGLRNAYKSIKTPAVAGISEMGRSMLTVAYTTELVPETREYTWGSSYYDALLTVVPNLFWNTHPASAEGFPATWLIRTVDPYSAALGGGMGYSFIAEAYLNFGWWGVPGVLAAIGFLFSGLVLWADRSGDVDRLAMVAAFLAFFIIFARGQSADIIRAFAWYSLLPYLVVRYLRYMESRHITSV